MIRFLTPYNERNDCYEARFVCYMGAFRSVDEADAYWMAYMTGNGIMKGGDSADTTAEETTAAPTEAPTAEETTEAPTEAPTAEETTAAPTEPAKSGCGSVIGFGAVAILAAAAAFVALKKD